MVRVLHCNRSSIKTILFGQVSDFLCGYGDDFENLSPGERTRRAGIEIRTKARTGNPCPFHDKSPCFKKGGVCSLRLYEQGEHAVAGVGHLVTVCPWRFLEQSAIFGWVGETILQTDNPLVLSQVGFLSPLSGSPMIEEQKADKKPATSEKSITSWSILSEIRLIGVPLNCRRCISRATPWEKSSACWPRAVSLRCRFPPQIDAQTGAAPDLRDCCHNLKRRYRLFAPGERKWPSLSTKPFLNRW